MKVGRRQFLKMAGATVASAVASRGRQEPVEENKKPSSVALNVTWDEGGKRYYLDGVEVEREEFIARTGSDVTFSVAVGKLRPLWKWDAETLDPRWYTPSWLVDATRELEQRMEREAWVTDDPTSGEWRHLVQGGGSLSLDGVAVDREELDRFSVYVWSQHDCDFYLPVAQGSWVETWPDPWHGMSHPQHTTLEWFDHGLHTNFMIDGQPVGEVLSARVDPPAYLRSVWAAGQVALRAILSGGLGGGVIELD